MTARVKRGHPSGGGPEQPVVVVAIEDMTDETFFKHYSARHLPDVGTTVPLHYHQTVSRSLIDTYRAFHDRIHTLQELDHEHEEEEG